MPCDSKLRPGQSISERKTEIIDAIAKLSAGLTAGKIKPKIGPTGGIAFEGWTENDRNRITDACAYRRLMATGSAMAKAAIAKAEQLAGRGVNRQAVAQGHHSHDDGHTWHSHKG